MGERYVFTVENLTKQYGKTTILNEVNLAFYPGAKIGVLGSRPNLLSDQKGNKVENFVSVVRTQQAKR